MLRASLIASLAIRRSTNIGAPQQQGNQVGYVVKAVTWPECTLKVAQAKPPGSGKGLVARIYALRNHTVSGIPNQMGGRMLLRAIGAICTWVVIPVVAT